jgi:site-specific DNA recombinase
MNGYHSTLTSPNGQTSPTLRAATYARVSTEGQAERGYSLPEQQAVLSAYCQRNGLTLTEHVADEGVSGILSERPGLLRIRELAKAGAIDAVVAVKLDRLGRRNWIVQQLMEWLKAQGIQVLFVEHGSGDKPADRLLMNVLGGVAEFNHSQIAAESSAARHRKAKSGKTPGGIRVYGYDIITTAQAAVIPEYRGRDGEMVINEEEARIVRSLFTRYVGGAGLVELVNWLNGTGIRTKRGNRWSKEAVRDVLGNPTYTGRQIYGRQEWHEYRAVDEQGREKKIRSVKPRPEEEWTVIPCPALVDERTFQTAQDRLKNAAETLTGRPSNLWVLRGVVLCGVCRGKRGLPLHCHGRRKSNSRFRPSYHYKGAYYCHSRSQPHLTPCGTFYRADWLEAAAWDALNFILQPGLLAELCWEIAAAGQEGEEELRQELAWLEKGLTALDEEERGLLNGALSGIFAPHILKERAAEIHRNRAGMRSRRETVKAGLARHGDPADIARRAEEMTATARRRLDTIQDDPAELRRLYQSFLRIVLKPGEEPDIYACVGEILPHLPERWASMAVPGDKPEVGSRLTRLVMPPRRTRTTTTPSA